MVMKFSGMWARFRKTISPPVFPNDEEKTRIAGFLNIILLIVLIVAMLFAIPAFIITPTFKRVFIELTLILTVVGMLVLMRRGRVRLASAVFSSILLIVVSIGTYMSGGFQGSTMSAYFGIILITALLLGNWIALAFGLVTIAFTGWLVYADLHQLLPPIGEFTTLTTLWGEFSSVLIGMVGLLALVMNNLKRAYERTKRKEDELAFKLVESEQLTVWVQEASDFKSHLLARFSHELRTPLGVIVGMAEMLRLEAYGSMTGEQKKLLERIQVNSKYLETTFSELLEQSQLDKEILPMQVVGFSPTGILEKVTREFRLDAEEKGLQFEEHIAPDLPETLWGVPSRVEQILYHLISNAIKFTLTGSITVSLFKPDEGHWAMRVTDTGIGISREHWEGIFEPFRQVDESIAREYGGVGLGLSIMKRLTSSMKGKIRVESELGQGSTFTVTLPLVAPIPESNKAVE
jgi:signal transduction histidine kinase